MRYYDISIDGGPHFSSLVQVPYALAGENDPNALRVKFTIENDNLVLNPSASYVSVYGIDIDVMKNANTYNAKRIVINAGFSPGLPLANLQSQRPKLLLDGIIQAAGGNWRGSEISLDLLLVPTGAPTPAGAPPSGGGQPSGTNGTATPSSSAAPSSQSRLMRRSLPTAFGTSVQKRKIGNGPSVSPRDDGGGDFGGGLGDLGGFLSSMAQGFGGGFLTTPANLIHHLKPGQWLGDAITQTLTTAFPGTSVLALISQGLKLNYQDSGFYQNLQQITGYWKQLGQTLGSMGGESGGGGSASGAGSTGSGGGGRGIDTYIYNNQFILLDWTRPVADIALSYTDLIGQPTWVAYDEVFFSSVMRADLIPGVRVSFPQILFSVDLLGQNSDQAAAFNLSQYRQLIFNGVVWLHKIRHVGDSRSPDGSMWRTDCWGYTLGAAPTIPVPSWGQ